MESIETSLNSLNMADEEAELSPIQFAAKRGYTEQISEILENESEESGKKLIAAPDLGGNTPLHWASSGGHLDAVEFLLDMYTGNVNAVNKFGDTALHRAAWKGHAEVCALLIKHGATLSKDIKNKEGKTPLDLARKLEVRMQVAPSQSFGDDEEFDQEDEDSD